MSIQDDRHNLPSASGIHRIYACPGSFALEQQAPEATPDDLALEGQEIHEAMENEDFTTLDDNQRTIAERLTAIEDAAIMDWKNSLRISTTAKAVGEQIEREVRLWLHDEKHKRIASAKPDLFVIIRPFGFVLDRKTGYLPVTDARRNVQARIQALALDQEFGPFVRIRAVMASYRFRGALTVCDYSADDLDRAREELRFNLWRAQQPMQTRVPGIDQCRYCKAGQAGICREAAAFSLLPATVTRDPKDVVAAVSQLTPAELAYLHSKQALAEKVFEAVNTRLRALPKETLNEVGLDLGKPGKNREIADLLKLQTILYQHGITQEQFVSVCKAAIGKVESLLIPIIRERDKETSNEAAKKTVAKIVEPCVEWKEKAAPLIAYKKEIAS